MKYKMGGIIVPPILCHDTTLTRLTVLSLGSR